MAKWIALLLSTLVLVGCGTKFVYHNIDWIVIDYLEDYVDLTDEQEDRLSDRIVLLSQWHQSAELPAYIEQLDQWLALEPASFTEQDLKQQQALINDHYQRLLSKFLPDVYQLANNLSDAQAEEFLQGVAKRHQKFADKYQGLNEPEIRNRYVERISERMEQWLGDLTPVQQTLVKQWANEVQVTTNDWMAFQARLRNELKTLLDERHDESRFSTHLQALLFEPEQYYSPVLKAKQKYNDSISDKYVVQIVRLATPKQVRYFRDEVSGWKQLAQELNDDAKSSARLPFNKQRAEQTKEQG
ncbi:hypothetical protein KW462_05010 [Vibrio fluvialis]|nr:hypothetical protein [Vibrio fluvialis]